MHFHLSLQSETSESPHSNILPNSAAVSSSLPELLEKHPSLTETHSSIAFPSRIETIHLRPQVHFE